MFAFCFGCLWSVGMAATVTVTLQNAADNNVTMPICGLGTGGYGNNEHRALGEYPECWSDGKPDPSGKTNGVDCSKEVLNATLTWLEIGGRRIDNGDSYNNARTIGQAMIHSGVPRSEIFLVSKVGSQLPMGDAEVRFQTDAVLKMYQTTYVDLMLIHWPTSPGQSSDPQCQMHGAHYNATACRLTTWKALLEVQKQGKARAVGVSNYNTEHIQEIIDAGLPLPAVNQCPYNPFLAAAQAKVVAMCQKHNIIFNSYSPLGIPDWHMYKGEHSTLLGHPIVKAIATKHSISPAMVLLAWQHAKKMVYNPRTMRAAHMRENLSPTIASTELTPAEIQSLDSFEQDKCTPTNKWYECCGDAKVQPSIPTC